MKIGKSTSSEFLLNKFLNDEVKSEQIEKEVLGNLRKGHFAEDLIKGARKMKINKKGEGELGWLFFGIMIFILFLSIFYFYPLYHVWSKELSGKAQLKEAEWNRQIQVEEAKALKESSSLIAESEVIRARGVAEANEIIGDSLKGNEGYLTYLWINALYEDSNSIIYIPTEANLPILEATRTGGLKNEN